MKIIETFWFNQIGVIVVENETGERKAYIKQIEGISDVYDIQQIVSHGIPVYVAVLESILKVLKGGKSYEGKGRN